MTGGEAESPQGAARESAVRSPFIAVHRWQKNPFTCAACHAICWAEGYWSVVRLLMRQVLSEAVDSDAPAICTARVIAFWGSVFPGGVHVPRGTTRNRSVGERSCHPRRLDDWLT